MASVSIDLHKRVDKMIITDKCCVNWNSALNFSDDTSAQISPSRDDELKIRYIQYKITEHTYSPNRETHTIEDWMLPPKIELITVRRSELCNLDSASIMQSPSGRMIVDFIDSHCRAKGEGNISKIVGRIIDVVQNSTPLVPNDFFDVRVIEELEILHQVDDQATKAYLDYHFASYSGTCCICLDEFEVGLNTRRLPCLHVFMVLAFFSGWRRILVVPFAAILWTLNMHHGSMVDTLL